MISNIPVLTVNYNTPEFIERLVTTFRKFYNNKIYIIDGSDKQQYEKLKTLELSNTEIWHFGFNIHHGPGLAYGFTHINNDKILVLDSDIIIYKSGFFELLENSLTEGYFGIGDIQIVGRDGVNRNKGIKYLHPACMLVNRDVVLQWPLPIKHGAPMIKTMVAIHDSGKDILIHADWVKNDFRNEPKMYLRHNWQGTVNKTGGYHL
jgi:hypothetical protein